MIPPVFEILTWKSALNVDDEQMVSAMTNFGEVIKKLTGFLYQSLHKDADGTWICIYFWETEDDVHASNEAVAHSPEFGELMRLILEGSVSMEVLPSVQSSGIISFS